MPVNIEIKARCESPDAMRRKIEELGGDYKGCDHQIDTYFVVPEGRMKLREGNIEKNLIYYRRPDQTAPGQSDFFLHPVENADTLKTLLSAAFKQLVVVDKRRHIYFIDNVKFHVDDVDQLGTFVEIEAGDLEKPAAVASLRQQCEHYVEKLGIAENQLISCSYSDLLLEETARVVR